MNIVYQLVRISQQFNRLTLNTESRSLNRIAHFVSLCNVTRLRPLVISRQLWIFIGRSRRWPSMCITVSLSVSQYQCMSDCFRLFQCLLLLRFFCFVCLLLLRLCCFVCLLLLRFFHKVMYHFLHWRKHNLQNLTIHSIIFRVRVRVS